MPPNANAGKIWRFFRVAVLLFAPFGRAGDKMENGTQPRLPTLRLSIDLVFYLLPGGEDLIHISIKHGGKPQFIFQLQFKQAISFSLVHAGCYSRGGRTYCHVLGSQFCSQRIRTWESIRCGSEFYTGGKDLVREATILVSEQAVCELSTCKYSPCYPAHREIWVSV